MDRFLKPENVKMESLVIADQHAAVKLLHSFAHTARHSPGVGFCQTSCVATIETIEPR